MAERRKMTFSDRGLSVAVSDRLRLWFDANSDLFIAIPYDFQLFFPYLLSSIGIMAPLLSTFVTPFLYNKFKVIIQSFIKLLLECVLKTTMDCYPLKALVPSDAVTGRWWFDLRIPQFLFVLFVQVSQLQKLRNRENLSLSVLHITSS